MSSLRDGIRFAYTEETEPMIRVFNQYASPKGALCAFCEALLVLFAPLLAARIRFWSVPGSFESYTETSEFVVQSCVFAAVFFASFYWNGLYDLRRAAQLTRTLGLAQALGMACLILGTSYYLAPGLMLGRGVFFVAFSVVLVLVVCTRILGAAFWRIAVPGENTVILGTGSLAIEIAQAFHDRNDLTTNLVGFVEATRLSRGDADLLGYPVLGIMENLEDIIDSRQIRRIVVAMQERRGVLPIGQLVRLKVEGVRVEEAQSVIAALTGHVRVQSLLPSWVVFSEGFGRSKSTLVAKRFADVVFGITGFLVSLPVMILTAIAIKLDSKGPILYRQQRVGHKGKCFDVLKFRSMRIDAEINGAQFASAGDPRVTRIGRFLRRFRLDEFPQFINVIRGDMSFVGPRPERPVFVQKIREKSVYYDQRHSVRPGITGWAQVQYRYSGSIEDACVKLEYDLFYLQNMSMLFDLLIIFKTIRTVLITGEQALPLSPAGPSISQLPNSSAVAVQEKSAASGY
jgi:sugar transferase (PEP-CTERM system associated)